MEPADSNTPFMSRRQALKLLGAGIASAALPLPGRLSAAPRTAEVDPGSITRSFPRGGPRVPAIGLGTFMTFDLLPGQPRDHLREVFRRFWAAGGRQVDTSPLYGAAETNVGDFAESLGVGQRLFVSNKVWATGDYLGSADQAELGFAQSQQRLWRSGLDVMQCHNLVNVDVVVPLLQRWKREGRIKYVGISHHEIEYFDSLTTWIEKGQVDVVQVRYSLATRQAETGVLRAADEHGVAVMAAMPLEKARLHQLVAGRPLPSFAAELGIETWSQYFLKWVISHPAVTCALPATSNPAHLVENMGAMRGPLPDPPMRQRMLAHVQAIPGFDALESRPWYPQKTYPGLVSAALQELRGP
ncbi:aldo/keto reductase [Luteimonas suaedae]|uniref:aldo/keto reductase n=1 Tax=Luteimonas suaedae TaxID=2605430 RepID=UPI001659EEEB|nr:aldo/keto reductase [Luteimonas suaedae]